MHCGFWAFEQHVVFRNNDVPGVMMSSAAMRLMSHYAVKPGNKAVVLTGNDDGYLCALELANNGVQVALIVDMRANGSRGLRYNKRWLTKALMCV